MPVPSMALVRRSVSGSQEMNLAHSAVESELWFFAGGQWEWSTPPVHGYTAACGWVLLWFCIDERTEFEEKKRKWRRLNAKIQAATINRTSSRTYSDFCSWLDAKILVTQIWTTLIGRQSTRTGRWNWPHFASIFQSISVDTKGEGGKKLLG